MGSRLRRARIDPAGLQDRLAAADPGRVRLRVGLRASLSTALAALVTMPGAALLGVSTTTAYPGIMLAMSGSVAVNDPPARQLATFALLPLPSCVALLAGTLASRNGWASVAALTVVVFLSMWARRFGPRGFALGFAGFMSFFVAAFFRPPLSDLPAMMAGIVVAYVITAAVRLFVVRDDATAVVANARASFRSLCAIALEQLPLVLHARRDHMPAPVRRTFASLRRAALELQEQLDAASNGPAAQTWRDAIVDEELAVVTAGEALLVLRADRADALERALVAALHAARSSVRRPSHAHRHRLASMLRVVETAGASAQQPALRAFIDSLQELTLHRDVATVAQLGLTGTGVLPLQKIPNDEPGRLRFWTRVAVQAAIATGLAAIAGTLLNPVRWYWAVIAAFVVFNRAATTGDAVVRAWQRTVGTAAGVVAGLVVVEVLRGHVRLEVALLFACIFAGFYAFRRSYLFLVVCFTSLIAVFYSLLGRFTPGILLLRLEETSLGAGIAVLIAAAVLRTPTLGHARDALRRELHAACSVLQALLRGEPSTQLRERSREHDRALLDLLDAEELLAAPPLRARRHRAALPVNQVIRLGQRARLLTREALRGGDGERTVEARTLSASADALLRSVTREERAAAAPSKPAPAR